MGVEAAEEHDVRLRISCEHLPDLRVDLGDQVRGPFRFRVERVGDEGSDPGVLRVGVGQAGIETGAAQDDEHAVLALVTEVHLDPGTRHRVLESIDDGTRLGVGDASGAAIRDQTAGVEGGEIPSCGDVAGAQLEVEPGRRQRAAPEFELLGVVSEEPEVTGTGTGGDAGADGLRQPGRALAHEGVEVWRVCLLELGAVIGVGVATRDRRARPGGSWCRPVGSTASNPWTQR